MQTPIDLSYLSDCVIMLRYFEAAGKVRRAVSIVKKRSGAHENSIREFQLTANGLKVGPPLTEFSGILTGTPTYVGDPKPLMPENENDGEH
jgi:circadian clock protein KaiC